MTAGEVPPDAAAARAATPREARDAVPGDGSGRIDGRGDGLAPSAHGRFAELAAPPQDDFDPERAVALCAGVCRAALGDFAPALLLLPEIERRRAQAVAAFILTLFDFARQRGADGERLAQINRWEFTLEAALAGERIGQPIFLRLGEEQRRRALSNDGLDALFAAARTRATLSRPADPDDAARRRALLARGLALTLVGDPASEATVEFASGLLGLQALLSLGGELAGGRCPLPESELPGVPPVPPPERVAAAVAAECRRLQPLLLRGGRAAREVPLTFRRPAAFLVLASTRLLARVEESGTALLGQPPHLGPLERLALVARSRWGRLTGG